eukprot:4809449-Amphidinium_carterae.1
MSCAHIRSAESAGDRDSWNAPGLWARCGPSSRLLHAFCLQPAKHGATYQRSQRPACKSTSRIKNICNGAKAKCLLMKVWRAGRLPPPRISTHDLGVDMQRAAWVATQASRHFSTIHAK